MCLIPCLILYLAYVEQPTVRLVGETDEHWRHLHQFLSEVDAHLAAPAISHDATLVMLGHAHDELVRVADLPWPA